MHAFFMDALPILNEPTSQHSKLLKHAAYEDIIEKVSASDEKSRYYLLTAYGFS